MSDNNLINKSKIVDNGKEKPSNTIWEKCLIDYYNYTKEYIKHYKKSIEGNPISMLKYPYMKDKSEAIYTKLFNAQEKDILTEKQIKRIHKIQLKIANNCLT